MNLSKLPLEISVDDKPYLTAAFVECVSPQNSVVLADVVQFQPHETTKTDTFVLGNPVNPWVSGVYTFKVFWNPENGPGVPVVGETTFYYSA